MKRRTATWPLAIAAGVMLAIPAALGQTAYETDTLEERLDMEQQIQPPGTAMAGRCEALQRQIDRLVQSQRYGDEAWSALNQRQLGQHYCASGQERRGAELLQQALRGLRGSAGG